MTNWIIAIIRSELVDDSGSIADGEPSIDGRWDDLIRADETIILGHQSDDLLASSTDLENARNSMCADPDGIELAASCEQHLCTRIDHARVWLPTIVIDYHAFTDRQYRDRIRASDICLGFRGPPSKVVKLVGAFFVEMGMTVSLNDPIRGCSLPCRYDGHDSVTGLTLGLHKRLFVGNKDRCQSDLMKEWLDELHTKLNDYG